MLKKQKEEINIIKKYLIQILLVLFIILNVIDFLNLLEGDLDFFKKILSWLIIGYIFYKASFTNILIGKRIKIYDLLFIISFSLMSIIKSLALYALFIFDENSYTVFKGFLIFIRDLPTSVFLYSTFMVGLVSTILLSISLYMNNKAEKNSLIGSLNIKEGFLKYILEQLILIITTIFFGLILFNLFMEWFALAVDSIILVLGMIYYIVTIIHKHTKNKFATYISNVSNTGNDFYQNLITLFSNKNTIFIAISFLLTLHSLVDSGVYLVPYSIGTQNTLYFDSLGENHTPLFNLFNFEDSRFHTDLLKANGDLIIIIPIFIAYFSSLFFFFAFMVLPFYIFYNNVNNTKINFNKYFSIFLLASMIFYLMLIIMPQTHTPLVMKTPDLETTIRGIDIITLPIIENIGEDIFNPYQIISITTILFILLLFLFFRYTKYKIYFDRIIMFILLVFFLIYIGNFFTNFIQVEYNNLKEDTTENNDLKILNQNKFNELYTLFQDDSTYKSRDVYNYKNLEIIPFSDIKIESKYTRSTAKSLADHNDYLLIKIKTLPNTYVRSNNLNKIYFENISSYEIKSNNYLILKNEELYFIYNIGENYFEINNNMEVTYELKDKDLNDILIIFKPSAKEELQKVIEYIRLLFTSAFYIIAIISFTIYYLRKNLLSK